MKIKRGQYKQLKQISNNPQTKEMPGQYGITAESHFTVD